LITAIYDLLNRKKVDLKAVIEKLTPEPIRRDVNLEEGEEKDGAETREDFMQDGSKDEEEDSDVSDDGDVENAPKQAKFDVDDASDDEDDAPDGKKISLYFKGGINVKTLFPKYGGAIPQEIINNTQNHSITLEEVLTTNAGSNKAMMIIVWNMKLHLVKRAISDGTIPYSTDEHLRNWWIAQRKLWKSGHTETDKFRR
jgi:hypothetical protein